MLDYGARWYDPALGRFVSADTIVPNPANSQSLNRFAYVYNNPLRYIDPTGHISDDPHERREAANIIEELSYYGVTIDVDWGWDGENWNEGSWLLGELNLVLQSVKDLAAVISDELNNGLSDWENFRNVIGQPLTIRRKRWYDDDNAVAVGNEVWLYNGTFFEKERFGKELYSVWRETEAIKGTIVHELGHVWNNHQYEYPSNNIGWATAGERPPTARAEQGDLSEYWAELVKCKVYPSQIETAHIRSQVLGPKQQTYFSLMVLGACPVP